MAQRDILTSTLATEGIELKAGTLSILEKKGIMKMLKPNDYQLNPFYWRLVSYDGRTYLLGYTSQLGGAKATRKLLVRGCSINMDLPEKVVATPQSKATYLCIQCGEKNTFLKADSKSQLKEWKDAIWSALPHSFDQRLPRSVHNTADSAPRPGADLRRVNTTPAGQLRNRAYRSSFRASDQALAQQNQRSQEMPWSNALQSQQSANHPIFDDGDHYKGREGYEGYAELEDPEDIKVSPSESLSVSAITTYAPPELPKRNYLTSEVQEGQVKKESSKKIEKDKSNDDNEKEMRGEMNSEATNGKSLHATIERFRDELRNGESIVVEVDKIDLSPKSMKLTGVADCICIAALPNAKLHPLLHIDDVIVRVNGQTDLSIDFCYKLFRTTAENKVELHVKRVMHGILCHVILSANGDVDSLGLEFGNESQGNEVTAMHSEGLVAKSGRPSRPHTHGVVNSGMVVNWGLVEINQSPVSFESSPADVRDQIQRSGRDLALVFLPMDLIMIFKERLCGESTEHTFEGEGAY